MSTLRLALCQRPSRKGRVEENLEAMAQVLGRCQAEGIELVVFPEAATSGYFVERGVAEVARSGEWVRDRLHRLAPGFRGWVCTGFYESAGDQLHNAALLADLGGTTLHVHRKLFLPTYGVFDEKRFVSPGRRLEVLETPFARVGLLVCEDAWHSLSGAVLALKGADLVLVPSASPGRGFEGERPGNLEAWRAVVAGMASEHALFVALCNLVGFEGSRGFPGGSLVAGPDGRLVAEARVMEEDLLVVDLDLAEVAQRRMSEPLLTDLRTALPDLVRSLHEVLDAG